MRATTWPPLLCLYGCSRHWRRALVLTNAAGGVNWDFNVGGDIMLITDHINFMGANPCAAQTMTASVRAFAI